MYSNIIKTTRRIASQIVSGVCFSGAMAGQTTECATFFGFTNMAECLAAGRFQGAVSRGFTMIAIEELMPLEHERRGCAAATDKHLHRDRSCVQLSEEMKKGLREEGIDVSFFPPGMNGPASSAK
jgi:hypothetical protein